jgi:hypothetical protein
MFKINFKSILKKTAQFAVRHIPLHATADIVADVYDWIALKTKNKIDDRFGHIFRAFLHDAADYAEDQSNKMRDKFVLKTIFNLIDFGGDSVKQKALEKLSK